MARLIDADALMENTKHLADACYGAERVCEKTKFQKMIKNAPTIDAVPVTRCGECYYKDVHKRTFDEDRLWRRIHHMYVTADWFCADGERKDGEHE